MMNYCYKSIIFIQHFIICEYFSKHVIKYGRDLLLFTINTSDLAPLMVKVILMKKLNGWLE